MTDIVSPDWLAGHLADSDLVVLDGSYYLPGGRDAEAEYRAGHIPGALRFDIDAVKNTGSDLPHMLPAPVAFAEAAGRLGITAETRVIAYDGAGLFSAARVAWTFRTFGSRRVGVLDGGLPAWIAEARSLKNGPPRVPTPATFVPDFDARAVASRADVTDALSTGAAQLADARSPARFTGAEPEPRPDARSGHMPGARNVHYSRLVSDGRLKPEAALRAEFEAAGIDLGRPVITTCGSGVTAAILSLALERLGHPARALYDGSWAEWGSRRDTEVETG